MYNRAQPETKRRLSAKIWLPTALLAVAALVTILELTDVTYLFHDRPPAPTATAETKGEPQPSQNTIQNDGGSDAPAPPPNSPSDNKDGSGAVAALLKPTGTFVSNHSPNLDGDPAPNRINSVCTTTPGASCAISFTKDGATKVLPAQTTDRGGSTYWNWKLQDYGLTTGSWQIKATATLGSQTESATDAINMEVAP